MWNSQVPALDNLGILVHIYGSILYFPRDSDHDVEALVVALVVALRLNHIPYDDSRSRFTRAVGLDLEGHHEKCLYWRLWRFVNSADKISKARTNASYSLLKRMPIFALVDCKVL